jgi:DNA-binding cell septation regulator SpoVG
VIKVSKELMGLFCYIEKRKRTMIRELADALRQVPPHMREQICNSCLKQYHKRGYSSSISLHQDAILNAN